MCRLVEPTQDDNQMELRTPCTHCNGTNGYITEKGVQDVMYCQTCDRYQYCAPRIETGKRVRTVQTREGLRPSDRGRVLARTNHTCIACGRKPPDIELHIGHLISRSDADKHGFLDEIIDHHMNLAAVCAECNLGAGNTTVSVTLMYRCIQIAIKTL